MRRAYFRRGRRATTAEGRCYDEGGTTVDAAPTRRLGAIARRVAALALTTVLALAAVTVLGDLVLLGAGGARPRVALGNALVDASFSVVLALFVAPYLAAIAHLERRLCERAPRPRARRALLSAGLGGLLGWLLGVHSETTYVGLFSAAMALALTVARAVPARSRAGRGVLLAGVVLAIAVDGLLPPTMVREIHDAMAILAVLGMARVLGEIGGGSRHPRGARIAGAWALALAGALVWLRFVDDLAPGWRAEGRLLGRHASRMARFVRTLVDFDSDGYSPIAWGGDCDDLDATRNPVAQDRPGAGDANCNGVSPPAAPTEVDYGLLPPEGDPALPRGRIDQVVVLSIDSLRWDTVGADTMPNTAALAKKGLQFSRMYAPGTRTLVSLSAWQRPTRRSKRLPVHLGQAGVAQTVIFGLNKPSLIKELFPGYASVRRPKSGRWRARVITDKVIEELERPQPGPRFVWAHYFDVHFPYPKPTRPPPAVPPGSPPLLADYRGAAVELDEQLARIYGWLSAQGRLERTVLLVTSDHGEGFGEHNVRFHGVSVYESIARVPAILLAPGLGPGVVDTLTSQRDFYPTFLGALGLLDREPDAERFGRSLLRLRAAPAAPLHRFVVVRSARSAGRAVLSHVLGLVAGSRKLVYGLEDSQFELFDLAADPKENRDVFATTDPAAIALRRALAVFQDLDDYPPWDLALDTYEEDGDLSWLD